VALSDGELIAFRRDGFVVVPNFLDPREVAALRAMCLEHKTRGHAREVGGGLVVADLQKSTPEIGKLLTDPRALEIARQLVGPAILHPYQDAVHIGPVNRGWHKDAVDYMRPSATPRDHADDYRLVHFSYYLQEHVTRSGAISFKKGSHRVRNDRDGEVVVPRIEAGDLVIFDLRTTHFGNTIQLVPELAWLGRALYLDRLWRSPRLRLLRPARLAKALMRRLPKLFLPDHGDGRLVIFFVYGADDAHTKRFFDWLRGEPDYPYLRAYNAPLRLA
jgi:hypothetical protein